MGQAGVAQEIGHASAVREVAEGLDLDRPAQRFAGPRRSPEGDLLDVLALEVLEGLARGLDVARRVRTGSFGVNQPYSMDPAAPFGGIKASGIGRELGREGLEGYVDLKAISGAPSPT